VLLQEPFLISKLDSAERTWKELSVKLADPDIVSNPTEYQKLAQSVAELDEVLDFHVMAFLVFLLFELLDHVYKLPHNLRYLIKAYICLTIALANEDGSDPDMDELVSHELEMLFKQLKDLEDKLKVLT
ncbi:hypothetical protein BHE74_00006427, partial [Ensete ventricosum]